MFKRAKAYEGGTYKGRLEIQDKPKFKKRVSNQVTSNCFLRLKRIGFLTLSIKSKEVETHQVTNQIMKSVVTSIGVNAWREREISLVVEKRDIKLGIVLM